MRGLVVMDNDAGDVRVIVDTRVHPNARQAASTATGIPVRGLALMGDDTADDTYRIYKGKRNR